MCYYNGTYAVQNGISIESAMEQALDDVYEDAEFSNVDELDLIVVSDENKKI